MKIKKHLVVFENLTHELWVYVTAKDKPSAVSLASKFVLDPDVGGYLREKSYIMSGREGSIEDYYWELSSVSRLQILPDAAEERFLYSFMYNKRTQSVEAYT